MALEIIDSWISFLTIQALKLRNTNVRHIEHIGGRKMKAGSDLFFTTSSAIRIELAKRLWGNRKGKEGYYLSHLVQEDKKLVKEVKEKGFKITEEKVIFITKDKNGKIRWLEKGRLASEGNRASGLVHILNEHALHFNRKGISANLIPALIKKEVEDAKIVGKSGKDRDVYETTMNGKIVHIAITISDNGYIVGAHPLSIKKGKK